MSKQTKATLKNYFKTGAIPTESQFADLIDSGAPTQESEVGTGLYPHKDSENLVVGYEVNPSVIMINVSAMTGATYATPEAAFEALAAEAESISTPVVGMSIRFKDAQNRVWDYKYLNSEWVQDGERSSVVINEPLDDTYINSSGDLVVSPVVSGTGTEEDPYIYKFGTTPFVEIAELEGIYYKGQLDNGYRGVCFYDENHTRLAANWCPSSLVGTATNSVKEAYIPASSIPEGTKYVRFSTAKAYEESEFRIETEQATERNSRQIVDLRKDVSNLKLMETGGVAGFWAKDSLNPEMESFIGDKSKLDDWDFYLVKEDGDNSKIVGKLQKNNILRFEDGRPAPVMVIPDDAEVENPWETHDQSYGILRAWNGNKFILNGEGNSGRTVYGIFSEQVTIDGVTAKEIEMTGICADLPTLYNGKLRCILFKTGIDTGCGFNGQSNIITAFKAGAYPKTSVNQLNVNTYGMAKNTDPATVSHFAPQMGIHKLSHIFAHFLKYGTYDLHSKNLFGGGISSNDTCNAGTWGTVSGVRWSLDNKTTWNFGTFGTTPSGLYYNNAQGATNWSILLNQEFAKLQTLEAQAALSYVVENNISPDMNFEFNGGKYFYKTINGTKSPQEGEMNAKLFKMVNFQCSMFDASGDPVTVDVEVMLQVGVVDGYISWGDVFDYGWAGTEIICHHLTDTERRLDAYLCTKQHNLYLGTDTQKTEPFDLQASYEHIGTSEVTNIGDSYVASQMPYSLLVKKAGGGLHTGGCAYNWRSNGYGGRAGNYTRLAVRSRGAASYGFASSRSWSGASAMSYAIRSYASAYQLRLVGLTGSTE